MADRPCLNCQSALPATARFCPNCSQRTDTSRLTFADMARDLLHAFVNIERGPLAFALALLSRPGGIAREYVAGRRRRHYGPFATLAVLVGFTALAVRLSGYQVLSQDGLAAGPAALLHRHFDLVLLMQLPLLGGVCALWFRAAGLTLPEHMVLVAYTLGVRALALALTVPLALLGNASTAPTLLQTSLFWGAWYLYFGWAASQFYPGARWRAGLRGTLAAATGHALTFGALAVGNAAYAVITGA